jgi:putative lipoic acid-binding regulatory protein
VYEIITNDLKALKQEIVKIIKEKTKQKTFDTEEIRISKESKYYNHIDFNEIL